MPEATAARTAAHSGSTRHESVESAAMLRLMTLMLLARALCTTHWMPSIASDTVPVPLSAMTLTS